MAQSVRHLLVVGIIPTSVRIIPTNVGMVPTLVGIISTQHENVLYFVPCVGIFLTKFNYTLSTQFLIL